MLLILCLPALAVADDATVKVLGSSGKYFADQPTACEAAQADAVVIAKDSCTRNAGTPGTSETGECTCEQGGFENKEWLCSAPATMECASAPVEAAPPEVATGVVDLEVRPPTSKDPLEIASYAFKRRGESLPASLLKGRFSEACSSGWALGCDAPTWVVGDRYDLTKATLAAEVQCKNGDSAACVVHGWALEGEAVANNDGKFYREAAKIYKQLCVSQKLPRACYEYGTILFNSLGVASDPVLGINRWEEACNLGDAAACTVLAKVYRKGIRTKEDRTKAKVFAEKACDAADASGCLEKAWLDGIPEATIDARIAYCISGGVNECWDMANSYIDGTAPEPRPGLARGLLGAGCELAHAPSCTKAATMALTQGDDPDAAALFRTSCDLGEVQGCAGLADMLLTERAEGDVRSEQYAFEVACSKGEMVNACSALGLALLEEDRAIDRPRARALLRQSCLDATSPAKPCFVLGDLYETGAGGERDRTLAARYYKWSCAQGWGEACERRGDLLDGGVGVREDDNEAVVMYQFACDRGSAEGCYKAAVLLDDGTNITRDPVRALSLYQTGCERKVGGACLRLGRLMLEGAAAPRDEAGARDAFQKAVDLGNVEAHRKLSWVLWNGVGGKKDKKTAKTLAAQGCQAADPIACKGPAYQTEKN